MTNVITSLMACEAVSGSEHCFRGNSIVSFLKDLRIVKILLVWFIAYSVVEDKIKAAWVTLGACFLSMEFENFVLGIFKDKDINKEEEII